VERATLQVASRVWVMRTTDLEAVKKELEFWEAVSENFR